MIRIYLMVIFIVAIFLLLRWFLKSPPLVVKEYAKKFGFVILAAVLAILALLGKLNWLFALGGVLFATAARVLPIALRYAPQLQRLWFWFRSAKTGTSDQRYQDVTGGTMSRTQAYHILGLKPGASDQEIIQAHRKLMQKVHPDRGGSDFLAAQINQAKKKLLGQ